MKVKDITSTLEAWAPLKYQESYDNCGLLVGDSQAEVQSVLVTLDVTEEVIDEAIELNCELIVAHHPLIFKGLKKVTNSHWVERCTIKAIKNDIAIYAIHTDLDNVHTGVNSKIAEKLQIQNPQILAPKADTLFKLTTFIPEENTQEVLKAMHEAGAGNIGEYSNCSFSLQGTGRFLPSDEASPAIGASGSLEEVYESRVEVIVPKHLINQVLNALNQAHPYEEVAYYLNALQNKNQEIGSGMWGNLPEAMEPGAFIQYLKDHMALQVIRHTRLPDQNIEKIAFCGGAGSFLLNNAKAVGADVLVSADFRYHDFFEADNQILIADIGHYESEVFTKELISDSLRQKFANIAVRLSEVNTNPITYS